MKSSAKRYTGFLLINIILIITISSLLGCNQIVKPQTISYGDHVLQELDYYKTGDSQDAKTIIFIHGGAWKAGDKSNHYTKAKYFVNKGYNFVSINYRLAPENIFPDNIKDIAQAVSYVINRNKEKENTKEIFIIGHSAGAHLAALIAIDHSYLKELGHSSYDIDGIILLDGVAYDIPLQKEINNASFQRTYAKVFKKEDYIKASPAHQITKDYIPPFQIFYIDSRQVGSLQSESLYHTLIKNNHTADIIPRFGITHEEINKNIGKQYDTTTTYIMDFLH